MYVWRNDAILDDMKKLIYPLAAALVIALDQLTKYAVRETMQPGDRIPILG